MDKNLYKQLIEESPIGYICHKIIFDKNGVHCDFELIEMNPAFEKLLELGNSNIIDRKVDSDLANVLLSEFNWFEHIGDIINGGKNEFEHFSETINKWLEIKIFFCDKNYYITRITDITFEKRQQTELESIEKDRLIFENIPLGVLYFDELGCITDCNEKFVKIVGSTMQDIIGLNMFKLPDKELTEALKQALHGKNSIYEGDYQSVTADKVTPIRLMFAPIKSGKVFKGGIGIIEDITERKQVEDALQQSNETSKNIIKASPDGIALISLDGKLQLASEKLALMYGYNSNERQGLLGRYIIDFIAPSCHKLLTENICKLLGDKPRSRYSEYLAIKKDGNQFLVEVTSTLLKDYRGKPTNILIVQRDITERKASEEALRISEEKYISIFNNSPIAIELYDGEGCLTHVNQACIELFGISSIHEVINFKLFDDPNIDEVLKIELLKNKYIRFETVFDFNLVRKMNLYSTTCSGIKNFDVSIKSIFKEERVDGYIVQILDITEQKKARAEIEYLSYRDSLTGLYNRRFYEEEVKRLDVKRNLPLTLIVADVNGLKLVNDSLGHVKGDELIVKVAETITKACRSDEIVARIGGDEFVIILPKTDAKMAEQIINRMKKLALNEKVGCVNVSFALGYKTKINEAEDIEEIFKYADYNMYENK